MRESSTQRKINEQAREAVAAILLFDISDPRLASVTVTGCKVSPDRSHCAVFYEAPAGQYEACEAAFKKAAPAIRACFSKRLNWRVTPAMQFVLDATVDEAFRISAALEREAGALAEIAPEGGVRMAEDAYVGLDGEARR